MLGGAAEAVAPLEVLVALEDVAGSEMEDAFDRFQFGRTKSGF